VSPLNEKRSVTAWCEMARRGAEDGHGDEWIDQIGASDRIKAAMRHAAQEARDRIVRELEILYGDRVSG
jgi:hypothetical protein